MADAIGTRGKELKKLLAQAKKKELHFAYCPGGQVQDDVFMMHRKKKPEVLGREARAEGEGSKIGFGRVEVTGKIVSLSCDRVISGMAKKLKKYLAKENCKLNVRLLDADGTVLEEDIEDLGTDDPLGDAEDVEPADDAGDEVQADDDVQEAPGADNDDDGEAKRLAALKARAATLAPQLKALPQDVQPAFVKKFKSAVAALQGGDPDSAEDGLNAIDAAMTRLAARQEAPAAAPPPPPEGNPAAVRLKTAAASLGKRISGLADGDGKTRLEAALQVLNGQIDAEDFQKAAGTAKALGEAITKVSAAQSKAAKETANEAAAEADDPAGDDIAGNYTIPAAETVNASEDGRKWNAARAELEPVVLRLLGQQFGDTSKMRAAWAFFTEKGNQGAYGEAMKAVPGTQKLIDAAYQQLQSEAEKAVPENVVEFVRARLDWSRVRPELDSELIKLQNAILAVCQGEEFAGMANETKSLFSYLKVLDNKLESALDAVINEDDPERRAGLQATARSVVGELQSELGQGFFQDVDASNGFVELKLKDQATRALARVDEVLQRPAA